ncbi:MAG: hypothetical protein AB1813_17820 [Verrucomicrobiota bacterium]
MQSARYRNLVANLVERNPEKARYIPGIERDGAQFSHKYHFIVFHCAMRGDGVEPGYALWKMAAFRP